MRSCTVLVALTLAVGPAVAREMSAAETAAVAARADALGAAVRASDYPAVVSIVPPKVFETIAADNNIEIGKLRDVVVQQMKSVFEGAALESFAMDVPAAEQRALPDGTPYLLIPTTTVVAVPPAMRVQFDTKTLALEDGGAWYLVRLDDPNQIDVLRRAYPAFAGETLPLGASRPLPPG